MAFSIAVQIAIAVEARLGDPSAILPSGVKTPPAGLTVVRGRVSDIRPEDVAGGPLINLSIGAELDINRDGIKNPMTVRTLELLVGIYANANTVLTDEAVDPAYNWLIHALQSEPSLGGLAHWVSEESSESTHTMWFENSEVVAAKEVKLHLEFHTRTDDPQVRNN